MRDTMRQTLPFNFDWQFREGFDQQDLIPNNSYAYLNVHIPHQPIMKRFNSVNEKDLAVDYTYRKAFLLDASFINQEILLQFDGVAHQASVYVNGHLVQKHIGGYTGFTVNCTEYVDFSKTNWVVVHVDAKEDPLVPPFGFVVDYLGYAGMYREVYLHIVQSKQIESVFAYGKNVLEKEKTVMIEVFVKSRESDSLTLVCTVEDEKKQRTHVTKRAIPGNNLIEMTSESFLLWDIDAPNLLYLRVELYDNNRLMDVKELMIGLRDIRFTSEGFYLNGSKRNLIGLNRHQSYPYIGMAATKRLQQKDAHILKHELGVNVVRTSHYPQSHHFINECDRLGILVFTELPGWQHVGNQTWQTHALRMLEEMIVQYRNHPSIMCWGVRINESEDHHDFYLKTNELARKLDPHRITTGVRNFEQSELLEDVYSFNDFSFRNQKQAVKNAKSIYKNEQVPIMITEHNGHMFPTKSYDDAFKQSIHAYRHHKVIMDAISQPRINAVIGWCMNDYHTHKDFGSGDKICHHGVMDMYRQPKVASYAYSKQRKEPFLQVDSSMIMGDYPASSLPVIKVYTNCQHVRFYKNNELIHSFDVANVHGVCDVVEINDIIGNQLEKHENMRPHIAKQVKKVLTDVSRCDVENLPLLSKLRMAKMLVLKQITYQQGVDLYTKYIGNWGSEQTSYRFDGYQDGNVVCSVSKGANDTMTYKGSIDTTELVEKETIDMAQVVIEAVDEYQQRLPYTVGAIDVVIDGILEVCGPKQIPFVGGVASFYVRTKGKSGPAKISVYQYNECIWSQDVTIRKD